MATEPDSPPRSGDLAAELAGILRTGVTLKALRVSPGRLPLLKQRRPEVARQLGVSADHVRDYREAGMVEAVAEELYARDSAYRLRHGHRTEADREPTRSRTGTEWFELHKSYRRVWTPVAALRDDLWVLLELLRDDADWPDIADRLMTMSWRLAQFSRELDRHVDELGGVWLLGDIEADLKVAGALRRIGFHIPLGEADLSWLRLVLREVTAGELDPFIDRIYPTERGKELVAAWLDWAKGCACDPDQPDPEDCEVHRWMAACDDFIGLIDDHWYRIADQYRATEVNASTLDVGELWQPREEAL